MRSFAIGDLLGILIAALGGAAVGLERQWSGHATGPEKRFAGIRTFTLLGLVAGIAGWLWAQGFRPLSAILLTGAASLIVAAYVAASRAEVEATTEMAAMVVLAAGTLAGIGQVQLSCAIIAITALLLVEKSRLHSMVERIEDASLRAGFRFAVMALVILPLLPKGPYGPLGGVRPRQLWALVLFFSGLSFVGYVLRRIVGPKHGYVIGGLLGGVVSSTNVALSFARASRNDPRSAVSLSVGVIAASGVMYIRVLLSTLVLNPSAALELIPYLVAPALVAASIVVRGLLKHQERDSMDATPSNPLQFNSALQMAVIFQLFLFIVRVVQSRWGNTGALASAAILGLTDMDALVVSMAKDSAARLGPDVIALAIATGALANTLVKSLLGALIGRSRFRKIAIAGLGSIAGASIISILWLR